MPTRREPVRAAFRFRPESDVWAPPFYREVAESLARSPEGVGFLLESVSHEPAPAIIPSNATAAQLLYRSARVAPGCLERLDVIPNPEPPPGSKIWLGSLSPVSPSNLVPETAPRPSGSIGSTRPVAPRRSIPDFLALPAEPVAPLPQSSDPWSLLRTRWTTRGNGTVRVRLELKIATRPEAAWEDAQSVAVDHIRRLSAAGFPDLGVRLVPSGPRADRRWALGRPPGWRTGRVLTVAPELAAAGVATWPLPPFPSGLMLHHHVALVGASGSGKSAFLASMAAQGIVRGDSVVVLDVHGDLTPAIVSALPAHLRSRVAAIDPTASSPPGPGIAVLASDDPSTRMRLASQVVASLRRLSSEGGDLYWGFRLERIFDTFVRIVLDESGDLIDLYELLTDERRRESSRLSTRDADAARFLEELGAILRRNPEFLWPAAARLVKVIVDRRLAALLAPRGAAVPIDRLIDDRRSVLCRLPVGELGPEGAGFAASLLAARIYLDRTGNPGPSSDAPRLLFILDEVHLFSPRLIAEILAEGRKFGVAALLATQYPERLAAEVRDAVNGAVGTHLVFRVPRASAAAVGPWIGLAADDAERLLSTLPVGMAVVATHGGSATRRTVRLPPPAPAEPADWIRATRETTVEFGSGLSGGEGPYALGSIDEALLFTAFASECARRPVERAELVAQVVAASAAPLESARVDIRLSMMVSRRYVNVEGGIVSLTMAGRRFLGYGAPSGATRESTEHRRLLLEAFRIFASKGHRIEVVRQGRFDRRVPDGFYRQLDLPRSADGPTIAATVDRARAGWAWRFFRGKNVHLEAEVSGALRPARIRHGLAKALEAGAFALFLVADAERARRVRATLKSEGIPVTTAQVWTLRAAQKTSTSPPGEDEALSTPVS